MLQRGTTRATFDSLLRDTRAKFKGDCLAVITKNPSSLDWLDKRLRPTIESAVAQIAGDTVPVEFTLETPKEEAGYQPELIYQGVYRDPYNEIVQPDDMVYSTRYFAEKWLPLLGGTLWLVIWYMRRRCYWNKKTGEQRDTFKATYKEIAEALDMSESGVKKILNPTDPVKKAYLDRFILGRETERRYSKYRGGTVNSKTIWRLRLDDPLTPDDELKLADLSKYPK